MKSAPKMKVTTKMMTTTKMKMTPTEASRIRDRVKGGQDFTAFCHEIDSILVKILPGIF